MTTHAVQDRALPSALAPLGLSRTQAAAYVGVSAGLFDRLVAEGRMPPPKHPSAGRRVWDRRELDAAFARLPTARAGPADLAAEASAQADNPFDEPE